MDLEKIYEPIFWIKFVILYALFLVFIWKFAPTLKWKVLFSFCGIIGIGLGLLGASMPGVTPVGRKF